MDKSQWLKGAAVGLALVPLAGCSGKPGWVPAPGVQKAAAPANAGAGQLVPVYIQGAPQGMPGGRPIFWDPARGGYVTPARGGEQQPVVVRQAALPVLGSVETPPAPTVAWHPARPLPVSPGRPVVMPTVTVYEPAPPAPVDPPAPAPAVSEPGVEQRLEEIRAASRDLEASMREWDRRMSPAAQEMADARRRGSDE